VCSRTTCDMLPFGMTILATVPQRSEIPEGLTNYPVFVSKHVFKDGQHSRTEDEAIVP